MITVRPITADDMPELQSWAAQRGCIIPTPGWPHGFLAVDGERRLMCVWMALLFKVPIAMFDHVYLPPRFNSDEVREAWCRLLTVMKDTVKDINLTGNYGYTVMEGHINPVMAAEAERAGGRVSTRQYKKCHYLI